MRRGSGGLGNAALRASGTPDQQSRWGGKTLAMAITEPGCGSDSKAVQTTATLDGDEWVINGEKIFVTTGCRAEGVVVWATISKTAGRAGIKSFIVMKGTPGFEVTHKEKKLGIRADDTAAYVFRDCRIPRDHLLGGDESIPKEGAGGFKGVMKTFNMTRPAVAAIGLGIAQAALDFTRDALAGEGVEVDWSAGTHARTRRAAGADRDRGRHRGRDARRAARDLALGRGEAEQPGGVDLEGQGRRDRAHRDAALHGAARLDGHRRTTSCSRSGSATAASPTSTRAPARSSA